MKNLQTNQELVKYRASLGVAPVAAGGYIDRFLTREKVSASEAAKRIGVSASTITRLRKGGGLTVEVAAGLEREFNLDSKTLFNLEANHKSFLAKELNAA